MGIGAVLHGEIVVVVGHIVEAHQVRDAGSGDRGLESLGLGDDPVRELPSVASSLEAESVGIERVIAQKGGVDGVEDVFGLAAVLIAEDGVGESLAVACRAPVVHLERRPSRGGVGLGSMVQLGPALAVRSALENED